MKDAGTGGTFSLHSSLPREPQVPQSHRPTDPAGAMLGTSSAARQHPGLPGGAAFSEGRLGLILVSVLHLLWF